LLNYLFFIHLTVHTEVMSEEHLSQRKTKFSSLVRFPWKNSTKRTSRANSWKNSSKRISRANSRNFISEDIHKKTLVKGRSFRSHSDSLVSKQFGKNLNRASHVHGRPKGYSDHGCYRRHFKNDKTRERKHVVRKSSKGSEPQTMKRENLRGDSNTDSAFNMGGLKRPKLSPGHNTNFRIRLYVELNVVKKPIDSTFKSASRFSRTKPIAMTKEKPFDLRGSDKDGKFPIHTGRASQSKGCSEDEEIFALDI